MPCAACAQRQAWIKERTGLHVDLTPRNITAWVAASLAGLIAGTLVLKAFGLPTPFSGGSQ